MRCGRFFPWFLPFGAALKPRHRVPALSPIALVLAQGLKTGSAAPRRKAEASCVARDSGRMSTESCAAFGGISALSPITIESVLRDVYGDWSSETWSPKPLPPGEAGETPSGQRRYLWTDAFGVLNFVALSRRQSPAEAKLSLAAASALIIAVHGSLGQPRSSSLPMREAKDGGYEGLRIGKEHARAVSDPGMEFDGMYWHYLDKWVFALARYARESGDTSAILRGVRLVKQIHPRFVARSRNGDPVGLYWKMNADLTVIPGRERTGANGDAVSGLIAYVAFERARQALGVEEAGDLREEISDLRKVVRRYADGGGFSQGTADPLGFGLQFWEAQFYEPALSDQLRESLRALAGSALHQRHFALPFRLYGGIIGGRLSGDVELARKAEDLLKRLEPREMTTSCGETEHSGINKVMFVTALDPSAFLRLPDAVEEPLTL